MRVWAFLLRLKGAETVCKKLCRVLKTTKISTMWKNLKYMIWNTAACVQT